MKVLLFAGDRYGARQVVKIMLKKGINIIGCVFEEEAPNQLSQLCKEHSIPEYNGAQIYEAIKNRTLSSFDLGISYLYHRIIKEPVITFAKGNIINFHPAPVHIHRGVAACCYCLLRGYKEWGVTAHYLTAGVDEGDVIKEKTFSLVGLDTSIETERYIQGQSVCLFGIKR